MSEKSSKVSLTSLTSFKFLISEKLPKGLQPDILYLDSENLPQGEIFPGIILFNAPENFIPIRAFVQSDSDLRNFVIQDSEQTEIFTAKEIQTGITCLNLKNGFCPPFLPTLNLSCQRNDPGELRVVIEYHINPMV